MEKQYQDNSPESNVRNAGEKAGKIAGKAARTTGKWAGKKIIHLTILTGGGCLIPLLVFIIIIIISGLLSSITLSKRYDYDDIFANADEGVSGQEALFDVMYTDIMLGGGFSASELNAMAFDMNSLKRMFGLIQEYNNEILKTKISVDFNGTYSVYEETGTIYYQWDGSASEITKERYEELKKLYDEGKSSVLVWEQSEGETNHYDVSTAVDVVLDNTWLRKKYQIPWQIVYMLCYYDLVEKGNSPVEVDEDGNKIRLSSMYIEQIIGDVKAEELADISSDYVFDELIVNDEKHVLDAVAYPWGKSVVSQEKIKEYGACIAGTAFYKSVYCSEADKEKSVYFTGYVPISRVKQVQTLTRIDVYEMVEREQTKDDLKETVYTVDKLEALLEKYGNGRDINMLLVALRELPGGADIAAEIEYAMEQQKKTETAEGE